MRWIAVKIFIGNIPNLGGVSPLEAKREALLEYVDPLRKKLKDEALIKTSNYTFHDGDVHIVTSFERDREELIQKIRDYLVGKGLKEGDDQAFKIVEDFYPQRMKEFWGKENMSIFAQMKDLSSTLAIEAFKGNLGEDHRSHLSMNRLGHIWSNQLGCDLLNEAYLYQGLARGYLDEVIKNQQPESSIRNQLGKIEKEMDETIKSFNHFYKSQA